MTTQTISRQDLISILSNVTKSTFINLVTRTKVRMNKTNNPYYEQVVKVSKCNYLIGNDYETRVGTNMSKEGLEGTFEVEEMKGKKHISKVLCVDTKTESKTYLMVERFDEIKPKVEYTFNNQSIDKVLFESFMVKVSESKKQEQERKVKVMTPNIDNVVELSMNGFHYIIE